MSGGALRLVWIHLVAYIRAVNTMGVSKFRRGRIQEESMFFGAPDKSCEKHHGSLPLVSVNTLPPKEHAGDIVTAIELIRSTEKEKGPADRERPRVSAQPQSRTRYLCRSRASRYRIWHQADLPAGHRARPKERACGRLRDRVRDAVQCHFDDQDRSSLIRLHDVKDEVLAA